MFISINRRIRCGALCLGGLLLVVSSPAKSELSFESSGKMNRLVLGGVDFSDAKSSGFTLRYPKGTIRLNKISTSGNKIKVSNSEGTFGFVFQIDIYPRHVAIHLMEVNGVETGPDYSLSLQLDSLDIASYTLNDLMVDNSRNTRRRNTELKWPYLWARPRADGSLGSVVLYNNRLTGNELDAVLAEIWSAQAAAGHMVKPAVKLWAETDVLEWVDRWVEKFCSISVISIHPDNSEEKLYQMTDKYVIPVGATRVYMFSSSWRERAGYITPRASVFPKGKADLLRYSEYLASHGIQLQLKSMTPQVQRSDARYISSTHVDDRLMAWSCGTLEQDISRSDSTIRFKGVVNPGYEAWRNNSKWQVDIVRIENEIVGVESITSPEKGVWVLTGCQRGQFGTFAQSHSKSAKIEGLVAKWNKLNYQEDFGMPNSLGEELYGEMLNAVKASHIHFDGTGLNSPPWYMREYSDYVYRLQSQPTTGSMVGRGGLAAHFEMKFARAKPILGMLNYWILRIGPRLHQKGRKHIETATSKLELHFDIANGILRGSRRLFFCGGQSGGKLSMELLEEYGLTDHCLELFNYWNEIAPVYADADEEYLRTFMTRRSSHHTGPVAAVLSKDDAGNYIYTPHHIMGRTSGEDEFNVIDQEWGAKARWQAIKSGTTMELENPYDEQVPQVMIFVKDDSSALKDPVIKVNGMGHLAVNGEIQPTEYMKYEGGNSVTVYDRNWNELRTLPARTLSFIVKKGKNTFNTAAGSGSDTPDLKVQYITLGPVYVLETNKYLADQLETANGPGTYQVEDMTF